MATTFMIRIADIVFSGRCHNRNNHDKHLIQMNLSYIIYTDIIFHATKYFTIYEISESAVEISM